MITQQHLHKMKKYIYTILILVSLSLLPLATRADFTNNALLVGGGGRFIQSTSSDPLYVNRLTATSTTASVLPYASTTGITAQTASSSALFVTGLTGCASDSEIVYDPNTGTFGCQQLFTVLTPPCTLVSRSIQFNFSGSFGCTSAVYGTNGNIGINGSTTPAARLSITGTGLSLYNSGDFFNAGTITSTSSSPSTIPYASTTVISSTLSTTTDTIVGGSATTTKLTVTSTFRQSNQSTGCAQYDVNGFLTSGPCSIPSAASPDMGVQFDLLGTFAASTRFIVDYNHDNKVGIGGTTTPWGRLSIAATAGNTGPLFTISTSTAAATTTVFIINESGNVGIGSTSPGTTLGVQGKALIADSVNSSFYIATSTVASVFPYASTTMITATTASTTNATTTNLSVKAMTMQSSNGTFLYNIAPGSIGANRKLTFPNVTSDDVFTVNGLAQSLQNKTFTGNFTINAGIVQKWDLVNTTPTSLTATNLTVGVDTTSSAITVNLPIAPSGTQIYYIYDEAGNASVNNITVVPSAAFSERINGQTSYTINKNYDGIFIYSVNAGSAISGNGEWHIIAKNGSGMDVATSTASIRNQTATVSSVNTYTPTASSTYAISVSTDVKAISAGTLTITCTYTNTNNVATTATFFPMGLTSAGLTGTGAAAFPTLNITPMKNTAVTVVATFTGVSITYDIDANILLMGTGVK